MQPGYNKQGYVYLGQQKVRATFDTGAFRNLYSQRFVDLLKNHPTGKACIIQSFETEPVACEGVFGASNPGQIDSCVTAKTEFRQPIDSKGGYRSATRSLT